MDTLELLVNLLIMESLLLVNILIFEKIIKAFIKYKDYITKKITEEFDKIEQG